MTTAPHKAALVVHTFFRVDRQTAAAVESLWDAVGRLGLDDAIGRRPVTLPPVDGVGGDRLEVLAARRRVVPGAVYEALAYRSHDVVGISLLLAPNDDEVGWGELAEQWTRPVPTEALGGATVFLGLRGDRGRRRRRRDGARRDPGDLRRYLPGGQGVDGWCRIGDELLLGELPPGAGRRLLVMGDARDEAVVDRWTWLTDGRALPPLTRYLLHSAKLRYQESVLVEAMPRLRAAAEEAEQACDTLVNLLRAGDPPIGQLLEASRALTTLQAGQGGLIAAAADAADMVETVRAARRNMDAALGEVVLCRPGGPVDTDRATARWLEEQLGIELAYLESSRRKAGELARLASTVLDEQRRSRQEALTLLQASLLGALVTALAAIQSFEYRVPLAKPLLAPLVCVLAVVALVLPAAALNWPRGERPARRIRQRYAIGAALLGAPLGWLVASVAWRWAAGGAAPPVWSMVSAVAGAMVCAGGAIAAITQFDGLR
ncbi:MULTISPECIES: CATRA conflict system CASPASE/TPR repeat-associated protein [Streptomyces]|uniref:CATRA conflict system CASPASE/TPR repeat-associated protein n=1 Tax=Streptomyces TaxID=1883 RepID=UPI001C304F0A|nr:CATRA conflict system CASPASE/TPR repeat-associated protein [Streptomyces sp. GbtcB7]